MGSTDEKNTCGLNQISKILNEMKTVQDVSNTESVSFKSRKIQNNYTWMIEECILAAYNRSSVNCPMHGDIDLNIITPDVKFLDLPNKYLIDPSSITKGNLLGDL